MKKRLLIIIASTSLLTQFPPPLTAQNSSNTFQAGIIIDTVRCLADKDQSYTLFLPENYSEKEKWPLMLIFDPGARGRLGIENFVPAGRKYGYILACSNNVRNGQFTKILSDADIMYNDVITRFNVDDRRIFAAGFSGGSRLATLFSVENNRIAGVLGCGAGLPDLPSFQPVLMKHLIYYGFVGTKDMNYLEMNELAAILENSGVVSNFYVFSGGHKWPSSGNIENAFDWFELQLMIKGIIKKNENFLNSYFKLTESSARESEKMSDIAAAERYYRNLIRDFPDSPKSAEIKAYLETLKKSEAYKKEVRNQESIRKDELADREKYIKEMLIVPENNELNDSIFNWWKSKIRSLNYQAKRGRDSLMASRLLNFINISSVETGSKRLSNNSFKAASWLFTIWTICDPENKNSWYNLARVYSLDGQYYDAINALDRSFKSGLNNKAYIIRDPAFAKILNDKRFIKLTDKMK